MPDSGFSYRRWTAAALALGMVSLAGAADLATPATFSKDIVPILQKKCQNCHRAGQIAPMSLVSYEETVPGQMQSRSAAFDLGYIATRLTSKAPTSAPSRAAAAECVAGQTAKSRDRNRESRRSPRTPPRDPYTSWSEESSADEVRPSADI
jgi:hypothetical protein